VAVKKNHSKKSRMTIACLGWGSLIWQPKNLKIQNEWFQDGPMLPIEFTRKSDKGKGRITLIIDNAAKPVRSLWALMTTNDLNEAKESLKEREGTNDIENIHSVITIEKPDTPIKTTIQKWLVSKDLNAAIWTGLSYSEKNKRLTIDDVLEHLLKLNYIKGKQAEEYIRKAPKQIDTEYRRQIEKEFGWTPIE
jgi:hypothetical protein